MRIAIVGASKLTENEERDAQQFCGLMMNQWLKEYDDLVIISGGAKGVDSIAENCARNLNITTMIFHPEAQNKGEYKIRNMKIAKQCDKLFCLPANLRNTPCYHCDTDEHERSGGCWTANMAKELGKEVRIIPPTNR